MGLAHGFSPWLRILTDSLNKERLVLNFGQARFIRHTLCYIRRLMKLLSGVAQGEKSSLNLKSA
jgi:hypothetical protein